jgi:hypothetical protein
MVNTAQKLGTPKALAQFVQQKIRYVAIEVGVGGYQPHLAEDTFRNQYGDCKDKVTLFRSLMKGINREVYPVLINADRGGLVSEFPSPLYFNHMIAAIPIGENEASGSAVIQHAELGRLLLFDPTDEKTPFGQLPPTLQGTQAVLIRSDRGFLIDTPISDTADNRLLRVGNFKIAADGKLSGDISENYWGSLSVRETNWLMEQTQDQWARNASRRLSRELPGNSIPKFVLTSLNQPDNLQEMYLIEASSFVQPAGDLLLFRPAVFGVPGRLITQEETRLHPYQFSFVQSQRTNFSFQLPEGYVVEAAPAPEELDLPYASYRSEIKLEANNTLRYIAVYDIKKLEVAAADFDELRKFFDLVERASRAVIILKRSQ